MAIFMCKKQKLSDLFSVIANEAKRYQLILNFNDKSPVLTETVNKLLESYPTTDIKKATKENLAETFLLSDKWLTIIVNGKESLPLDLPTLKQKRMLTPFVTMEIHEALSGESVNLFLTRCSDDNEIVRSMYSFVVQ
jgi:hypothetical protein